MATVSSLSTSASVSSGKTEEDAAYACSCCNGKFLSKQPLGSHQNTHELEGTAGTRKRRLDWAGAWDHDGEIAAAAPEVDLSLKL
jgi:hypothetical protein